MSAATCGVAVAVEGTIACAPSQRTRDTVMRLGIADIEKAISPRTKAILYSSPCNPTGAMLDEKTVRAIAENIRLGATCREAWRLSCYCNFFIGFLFLCSFIQDYLELTQAIMIPILLYIVAKARLRTLGESAQGSAAPPPRLARLADAASFTA